MYSYNIDLGFHTYLLLELFQLFLMIQRVKSAEGKWGKHMH